MALEDPLKLVVAEASSKLAGGGLQYVLSSSFPELGRGYPRNLCFGAFLLCGGEGVAGRAKNPFLSSKIVKGHVLRPSGNFLLGGGRVFLAGQRTFPGREKRNVFGPFGDSLLGEGETCTWPGTEPFLGPKIMKQTLSFWAQAASLTFSDLCPLPTSSPWT